ncbi:MAG: DUF4062 domain-containing protein, partial [Anaerolineaceae bacterium]
MKVFLSSTYTDLIEHRKAAHEALERLGQEVGRMEIFGARNDEATNAALTQLEKCDLVVGIYAYRYGSMPEGSEISITEQEYLHAKKQGKPVLCFVVDEDHPWSPKMMEKDAGKIKKLEDFKAKVLKEKVIDFFTTPADLAMKIVTSVHNYLEENKLISHPNLDGEKKVILPRWSERNKEATNYFVELCDTIDITNEEEVMTTLYNLGLLDMTTTGWMLSKDGALLFAADNRIPKGFHTDVFITDKRTVPESPKSINGKCLIAIIMMLQKSLSELWENSWEDPLIRDKEGRPKIISKYPQTAILEAMVNFIIHRDYSINDLAFVTVTNEYVEFENPGKSPYPPEQLLTIKTELRTKNQKNEVIIEALSRTRLNQRQGRGIIRIRETLIENGNILDNGDIGLEIENIIEKDRFRLRIYQKKQTAVASHVEMQPSYVSLPTLPYFFGRADELKTIASALSPDSRTWGALIDGPGGIGKTALAIKAAHDAPAELFEHKIFIAAKVRELTAEGEAKLTDFTRPNYLAMLDELGKELGADGLEKLAPDERPNELRLALAGKKALIIFDNLETLP